MPPRFLTRNLNLWRLGDEDDDDFGAGDDPGPGDDDAGGMPPGFDDDDDDTGAGDDPAKKPEPEKKPLDDGLDDLFEAVPEAAAEEELGEDGKPKVSKNPAITAVLDKIRETLPKGLHGLIIDEILAPELTKAQQGFDSEMAKVQPYRDLEKHNIKAEEAIEALRVAQFIRDNPDKALVQIATLTQQRGLNPAEILGIAVQQVQTLAEQQGGKPGAPDDADAQLRALLGDAAADVDLNAPENAALKAVLAQLSKLEQGQVAQTKQQQERQEQDRQRQEHAEIESAMARLEKGFTDRKLPFNKDAVLKYALAEVDKLPPAQRETLDPFEALKAGARAWQRDVQSTAQTLAGVRAPRLGGGRGGLGAAGAPKRPEAPKTIEDRKALFLENARAGRFNDSDDD